MSESWYVVPAAFALRNAVKARQEEQTSWLLPEGWRAKSQTVSVGVAANGQTSRSRRLGT